ncbi:MAG TPA: LuxR C-terminal-related transcriptional regulator [Ktedonobacteraceae bacterium]|nr:LuxR C-terminal-related transcriptional regulator [Ktedonobacteraceae bacterium]
MDKPSIARGMILDATLVYQHKGRQMTLAVDTPSWFSWLQHATSFTFKCEEGSFTAHRARASSGRGSWYWYAYRRAHGHLFKRYLGTSEHLTLALLREAAHDLLVRISDRERSQAVSSPAPGATVDVDPVLLTRLHVPRLPGQHVSRPRLLALLEQGVQRSLTVVSAPAGSGKTTLLAEWATTTDRPVTWLAFDVADNDPARFLSYLIAALARLDARIGAAIQLDPAALMHSWESVMTHLLNDVTLLLEREAVLILDDVHLITTDVVHAMLHFLLDHLPVRLHLVIGTRLDLPLPLARLRARNQLYELRAEELCFVSAELEAFVQTMGLTLSAEVTGLLVERTEGWIAGVQLLALVLRGRGNASEFLRASSGSHRFLLEYVSEEILAQQTPEMQHFLLRTSVLDRLCGPLCDAVTGKSDGQMQLAGALRANLFLSELDDTQTWYRYHPLFAEALRAHLHTQAPDLLPELYRRACYWYEQQQQKEEAYEYAFLAGELSHAASLLEQLVPHLLAQGKFLRLRQWLSQLPPESVMCSPLLSVASIWTRAMRTHLLGNAEKHPVETLIEHLDQQIQEHARDDSASWIDLQYGLPLLQAVVALDQGDISRTIALAYQSLPAHSRPESVLSQLIAVGRQVILGAAYRASGDLGAAEQVLLEIDHSGEISTASPLNLFAVLSLADLYESQGRLRTLGRHYDDLLQMLAQRCDPSPLFLTLLQIRFATLLYEWDRLSEAESRAHLALEQAALMDTRRPIFSLLSLWIQIRVARARGNDEQVWQLFKQAELENVKLERLPAQTQNGTSAISADTVTRAFLPEHVKMLMSTIFVRLALMYGQREQAELWEKTCGLRFDDSLPSRFSSKDYIVYVTLARVLLARGRDQRTSPALAQAFILLDHLRAVTTGKGLHGWAIEIQILTALVLQAQGKIKQALHTLELVLAQAEAEGYVRVFADEGQPMARLLTQIAPYTTISAGYIQRIQTAITPVQPVLPDPIHTTALHQPLPDRLSSREQEVLLLLAEGFSNQQIADHLLISLNTVKRHVKHLLIKLTVTNRTQAVARARDLQML